jgi:hypothetical protein
MSLPPSEMRDAVCAKNGGAMTRMAAAAFVAVFALMGMIASAQAQAGKPADGEMATPLLENEQARVRDLRLRPGAKMPAISYPNIFVYALTDGALVFAPADGRTPYELTFKVGDALWLPAQTASTNETNREIRVLLVEIKARAPSGKRARGKGGSRKAKRGA